MRSDGKSVADSYGQGARTKIVALYSAVAAIHGVGWGLLLSQVGRYPSLLGLGLLAYSFGLRHAFDADHISAIDNSARKLLHDGKRPVSVGLFFSLGHSTVVLIIALAVGVAAKRMTAVLAAGDGALDRVGGLLGTAISGLFLLIIGVLNLIVLLDMAARYRAVNRGERGGAAIEESMVSGGLLSRVFRRLFRLITASWHLYPVGFLFGLGFDTASEVGLLAISAGAATQGLNFGAILALPLLFAAGMSLLDTTDGAVMTRAYSWAFADPSKRIFYNLSVTALSVFVALSIGLVEILQIVARTERLAGGFWTAVGRIDIGRMGYLIVILFLAAWGAALAGHRLRRGRSRPR